MNKRLYQYTFLSFLLFCQSNIYANNNVNFNQPYLKPDQVIDLAKLFLTNKSINITEHDLLSMTFDYVNRKWWLYFQQKEPVLGGHFSLTIDDSDDPNIHLEGGA